MATKTKVRENTLSMIVEFEDKDGNKSKVEVRALNPGEMMPNFGGSRHALIVNKTASLVTSTFSVGRSDVEMDIYSPVFWQWIARLINRDGVGDTKITATTPEAVDTPADKA